MAMKLLILLSFLANVWLAAVVWVQDPGVDWSRTHRQIYLESKEIYRKIAAEFVHMREHLEEISRDFT